jgi:membrane protease YdiL (CAAX protease family)
MSMAIRMVVNLVLYLGLALLGFELQALLVGPNDSFKSMLDSNPSVTLIMIAGIIYFLLAIAFRIRHRLRRSEPKSLLDAIPLRKLTGREARSSIIVGLGCALAYFGLMGAPFLPDRAISDMHSYVDTFAKADSFLFVIIGVGFVGTFFEEMLFRGLVFSEMRRALPVSVAFVAHAVVYAYFQPNLTISFTAFFLALIYAYLYTKTGTVASTITAAVVLNLAIIGAKQIGLIDQLDKTNEYAHTAVLLVGLVAIAYGLYRLSKPASRAAATLTEGGALAESSGKPTAYFNAIGKAAIYMIIYYSVLMPIIYLWTQVLTLYEPFRPWLSNSHNNLWALVANDLLVVPIYYFLLRRYQSKNLIEVCNFSKISVSTIAQIAALSVFMGLWVTSIAQIPYVQDAFPQFEALFNSLVGGPLVPFLVFLIFHSVYKEILFRGLIFNAFKAAMPLVVALILDALVYGLLFFQLDPALTIYGGMGTVIFGLLYVWYKSLWAPIVAQLGLFSTYYATRHSYAAFEVEFSGVFYVVMAASSAAVLLLMIRLWQRRSVIDSAEKLPKSRVDQGVRVGV